MCCFLNVKTDLRICLSQVLWKSYIDFEIEQEETERTRNLYRRLLQRTQHVKVSCDLWATFDFARISSLEEIVYFYILS